MSDGYRLGPVSQVPRGEGRAFAAGETSVAVFRLRDGSLRALQARCPHQGGPLADGLIDDEKVICPLHLRAFGLADGACTTEDAGDAAAYAVELDGEEIVVHLAGTQAEPDVQLVGRTG